MLSCSYLVPTVFFLFFCLCPIVMEGWLSADLTAALAYSRMNQRRRCRIPAQPADPEPKTLKMHEGFMSEWEEKKTFWEKITLAGFNGLLPLLFFSFGSISLVSTWTPDLDVFKVCFWAFYFCAKQTSREALWAHISMKTTNACWWLYLRGGCLFWKAAINKTVSQAMSTFCLIFPYCFAFLCIYIMRASTARWFSCCGSTMLLSEQVAGRPWRRSRISDHDATLTSRTFPWSCSYEQKGWLHVSGLTSWAELWQTQTSVGESCLHSLMEI